MLKQPIKAAAKFTAESFFKTNSKRFQSLHPNWADLKISEQTLQPNLDFLQGKLQMSPVELLHIKNIAPETFGQTEKNGLSFEKISAFLTQAFNMSLDDQRLLFKTYPKIATHSFDSYNSQIEELKEKLGWSLQNSVTLLKSAPSVFFQPVAQTQLLVRLLVSLFERPQEEISEHLLRNPHLFLGNMDWIKKNNFLLFKAGLSIPNIYSVFKENPSYMLRNPGNLELILQKLATVGMKQTDIANTLVRNPFVVSLNFPDQLVKTVKQWREFGFKEADLGRIFALYPYLLTKRADITKTKLMYLSREFGIDVHKSPIGAKLLNFSLERFLKPRGTLMQKKGIKDWKEVLDLSDEAFCAKLGINKNELEALVKAGVDEAEKKKVPGVFRESWQPVYPELRSVSPVVRERLYPQKYL